MKSTIHELQKNNINFVSKKIILIIALTNLFAGQSQNLILNPSAEMPPVNGEIPFWTETIGSAWKQYDDLFDFGFAANSTPDGSFWFYAGTGNQIVNGQSVSELEQTIDISLDAITIDSGSKNYFFNGFVRTFEQSLNDQSNIFVQFFDANNLLLNFFNFGPFSDATAWNNINGTALAPISARKIKIKLHSILRNGLSNDGIYDNLYLGSVPLLGVDENTVSKSNISISPNPSTGIYKIQTDAEFNNATISVADLNGRIVHESKTENLDNKTLDLNNLQNGIYILNISNGDYNHSQKIVKQ